MACFNYIILVVVLGIFVIGINCQDNPVSENSIIEDLDTISNISADDYQDFTEQDVDSEYLEVSTEPPITRTIEMTTEKLTTALRQTLPDNSTEQQQVSPKPLGPYQFQVVDDNTGKVCIKAYLEAELIVHYISSKKTSLQQANIPVDTKATVGGTCASEQARLTLDWSSKTGSKYRLQTTFNMINDSVKCTNSKTGMCWMLTSIQFTYDSKDSTYFYHAKDARIKTVQSSVNKEFFKTPNTMSQSCDKDVLLKLPATSDNKNKDEVDIKFSKLQIQPFSLVNNTFGPRKECEEGNAGSQSVVSVAVGATLGVVILIVIIIYAVGRRIGAINDRTGYKSVD